MAERSFAEEVGKLRLGAGETFRGEGILAVTKALLESGVSYVAGYQGAPISHLMDVLADAAGHPGRARHPLREQRQRGDRGGDAGGVGQLPAARRRHLQGPGRHQRRLRRARQPRLGRGDRRRADHRRRGLRRGLVDHAGAQPRLRDEVADLAARPAPEPAGDRRGGEAGLRAVGGEPHAGDAGAAHPRLPRARPVHRAAQPARRRSRSTRRWPRRRATSSRIVLPPASFVHERRRSSERWPAAVRFIEERKLNEFFARRRRRDDIGIIVQGGNYNTVMRALERLGLADVYGSSQVPLYVMNVAYPVIESEVLRFCAGKRAVLMVEEGQPNFIEQNLATILRHGRLDDRAARQGHAAGGRRVHAAAIVLRGRARLPRALRRGLRAARAGHAPSRARRRCAPAPRCRWRTCTRGRRAFAPAAPSGRSSPR